MVPMFLPIYRVNGISIGRSQDRPILQILVSMELSGDVQRLREDVGIELQSALQQIEFHHLTLEDCYDIVPINIEQFFRRKLKKPVQLLSGAQIDTTDEKRAVSGLNGTQGEGMVIA